MSPGLNSADSLIHFGWGINLGTTLVFHTLKKASYICSTFTIKSLGPVGNLTGPSKALLCNLPNLWRLGMISFSSRVLSAYLLHKNPKGALLTSFLTSLTSDCSPIACNLLFWKTILLFFFLPTLENYDQKQEQPHRRCHAPCRTSASGPVWSPKRYCQNPNLTSTQGWVWQYNDCANPTTETQCQLYISC